MDEAQKKHQKDLEDWERDQVLMKKCKLNEVS